MNVCHAITVKKIALETAHISTNFTDSPVKIVTYKMRSFYKCALKCDLPVENQTMII